MKQRNNTLISSGISAFLAVMCLFVACNSNPEEFSFKNPQEAVKACHTELSNIRPIRKANIEELTMLASRWIALQDSTYSLIYRDSTIDINSEVNIDFFMVADSIREELTRLAVSEKRSLRDVVYFKIHTARDAGHLKQSKDYKNAVKFYDGLNSAELYPDIDKTMKEYTRLLEEAKPFKKEGEMLAFITDEDKCFRSVMQHLGDATQEDLKQISDGTKGFFEAIYKAVAADPENTVNSRVMIFLSMRFNRRIIQNAQAVQMVVKSGRQLTKKQVAAYHWMIIQPFLSIDNYSLAVLTEEQENTLLDMAEQLPRILSDIDGKDFDKSGKEKTDDITDKLTDYLLSIYLKQSL